MNKIIENIIEKAASGESITNLKAEINELKNDAKNQDIKNELNLLAFILYDHLDNLEMIIDYLKDNWEKGYLHAWYQRLIYSTWIEKDKKLIIKSLNKIIDEQWYREMNQNTIQQFIENLSFYDAELYMSNIEVIKECEKEALIEYHDYDFSILNNDTNIIMCYDVDRVLCEKLINAINSDNLMEIFTYEDEIYGVSTDSLIGQVKISIRPKNNTRTCFYQHYFESEVILMERLQNISKGKYSEIAYCMFSLYMENGLTNYINKISYNKLI